MEKIVYKLKYPVTLGEETVTELTFTRRAIVDDFKGLPAAMTISDEAVLLSRLTNTPRAVIGRMDSVDFGNLKDTLASFLQGGPSTGNELSDI